MLSQRILTALVLIPLFISAIFYASVDTLAWLFGIIVLLGAWEWGGLAGMSLHWQRLLYCTMVAVCLVIAYQWFSTTMINALLITASVFWFCATVWIGLINQASSRVQRALPAPLMAAIGIVVLVPTWLAVMQIMVRQTDGPWILLLLCLLIWGADSGAYFTGRRWGKHKLAANVSPGKTWQGVVGGFIAALLIAIPFATFKNLYNQEHWLIFLAVCLMTLVISVSGDLFESVMKRKAGVKDSSHILPGHGGILDRIDSLTAAAPVFFSGLLWLEKMQ